MNLNSVIGSGLVGLLAGSALPFFFSKLLPLVSRQARLRAYLALIYLAAGAGPSHFVKAFNNAEESWDDYADGVLSFAEALVGRRDQKTWELAGKTFRSLGLTDPAELELIE